MSGKICECWKLNGPSGSPICMGTKECDTCSCGGNKEKCDFYKKSTATCINEITVTDYNDLIINSLLTYGKETNTLIDGRALDLIKAQVAINLIDKLMLEKQETEHKGRKAS